MNKFSWLFSVLSFNVSHKIDLDAVATFPQVKQRTGMIMDSSV